MSESVILTEQILEKGKSVNGGWSLAQLKCFGFNRFIKGWKRGIIGKPFPKQSVEKFLALSNRHLSQPITHFECFVYDIDKNELPETDWNVFVFDEISESWNQCVWRQVSKGAYQFFSAEGVELNLLYNHRWTCLPILKPIV